MKFKITIISIAVVLVAALCLRQWHRHSPEYLASDPIHAFEFFDLPDYSNHYVDAMYNEGDDCLAFGSAHYWYGNLNENDKRHIDKSLYVLGAVLQGTSIVLELQRGDIIGKATFHLNETNNPLILSYEKL